MAQGYLDNIQAGSSAGKFTGNIKNGSKDVPFTDQEFVNGSGTPITDINELGFDSLIDYNENGGVATDCKACVQVKNCWAFK